MRAFSLQPSSVFGEVLCDEVGQMLTAPHMVQIQEGGILSLELGMGAGHHTGSIRDQRAGVLAKRVNAGDGLWCRVYVSPFFFWLFPFWRGCWG